MILPDLILESRINQNWDFSGMDSADQCLNKKHFLDYPHTVNYHYNSRGFRDSEWPESIEDLQNAIWCIGDSFTVGLGSPYEFTWHQILSKATGRRCINISMDGASNSWISRRACQIIQDVKPTHMVVLWSYAHRREHSENDWPDEKRLIHAPKDSSHYEDLKNFIDCYTKLNSCAVAVGTDVFNATIPDAAYFRVVAGFSHVTRCWNNIKDSTWGDPPRNREEFDLLPDHIKINVCVHAPNIPKELDQCGFWFKFDQHNHFLRLERLDYARDYHHFDKLTSEFFVQEICKNTTALTVE
jgi:hypothetical protein